MSDFWFNLTETGYYSYWFYTWFKHISYLFLLSFVLFSEPASHYLRPTKRWRWSAHGVQPWQEETRQVIVPRCPKKDMRNKTQVVVLGDASDSYLIYFLNLRMQTLWISSKLKCLFNRMFYFGRMCWKKEHKHTGMDGKHLLKLMAWNQPKTTLKV